MTEKKLLDSLLDDICKVSVIAVLQLCLLWMIYFKLCEIVGLMNG